ncbi:MAG: hypothetical protein JWP97_2753, partial [Labilithrix sp.]|nr:hypothetical protein [Labilithrix sp.]
GATLASCRAGSIVDIVDGAGAIDPAAYARMAGGLASADGIAYRYGPSYADCHARATTFPTAYLPPDHYMPSTENRPNVYQVGGPYDPNTGDFSSSQGQALYVPEASTEAGVVSQAGIATIEVLGMGNHVFMDRPRLAWEFYGAGNPDPNVGNADWLTLNGGPVEGATAVARTYARGEASANSIAVFKSGLLGAFGPNTARSTAATRLPAGKIPTAIALTGNNEFALITVWDPATTHAQLAVVALADQHPNLSAGDTWDFWGFDWSELYPGLMNYGYFSFMKVLGLVDLPDMKAPTEISASLDYRSGWLSLPEGGNAQPSQLTLSDEKNRQSFVAGQNSTRYPHSGFAVIVSRSEHAATFVDLQPLFEAFNHTYFGERAAFDAALKNTGPAPDQWPRTFDRAPESAPRVLGTVKLEGAPTAVRTALPRNDKTPQLAYIATMDGTITSYAVGGLADTTAANMADVRAVGTVKVGLNPTSLVPGKDHSAADAATTLIATSRADRRVDWITLGPDGLGTVTRTLRDSRLIDPIAAEDANNHGTESYVVTIADYAGRAVRNYRYGPVVFHTNGGAAFGMGADGKAAFEYGGAFLPRGAPFQVSTTNVP